MYCFFFFFFFWGGGCCFLFVFFANLETSDVDEVSLQFEQNLNEFIFFFFFVNSNVGSSEVINTLRNLIVKDGGCPRE